MILLNPLPPNGTICTFLLKFRLKKKEGIVEKKFYERRAYESVDDKFEVGRQKLTGKKSSFVMA